MRTVDGLKQVLSRRDVSASIGLAPFQQVFAKLKTLLRKAEERTVDDRWQRIGKLLQCFTPQECTNYLRNSG